MRRTLIVATCLVLAGMASQATHAAIIAGQYVPDGLVGQTGTQYRLIFVTSGSIQAESDDPADYDRFLAEQVEGTMLGSYDYGWKAVISTEGVDNRKASNIVSDALYGVDANKNYAGVYNTMGMQVDETGDDMLDGGLLHPVLFDQHGTSVYDGYAWTGSRWNGEPYMNTSPPGQVGGNSGYTVVGKPNANDDTWLQLGNASRTVEISVPGVIGSHTIPFLARIYGMSNVLEVPVVPEPATFVMWSLLAGIGSVVFWRRRRQGN